MAANRPTPKTDVVETSLVRPPGRGLRAIPRRMKRLGFWPYIAALGPGIIAASAGNDAGGIATYSTVGADYGYSLLWVMLLITVLLILVQVMVTRMGAVTGKGLSDLIREEYGVRWSAFTTLAFFIANACTTVTEFVGIGAAAELFGIPRWIAVPPMAALIWFLVTRGSYRRVETLFIALTFVFLSYIVSVVIIGPSWAAIGQAAISIDLSKLAVAGYFPTIVALIGTTITPYMQLYAQASVVEKGVTPSDYKFARVDAIGGAVFSNIVSIFIIIATAATLFVSGQHIVSAADAAKALEPIAGPLAEKLFGLGLFGASMLAAAVLPLATAYAVTEAIGFERGVSFSFREAPFFVGLFSFLIVVGTLVAMIPNISVVALLLFVQVVNGVLLPIELVFIMLLINKKHLMGRYTNSPVLNLIAYAGVTVIILAVVGMFVSFVL